MKSSLCWTIVMGAGGLLLLVAFLSLCLSPSPLTIAAGLPQEGTDEPPPLPPDAVVEPVIDPSPHPVSTTSPLTLSVWAETALTVCPASQPQSKEELPAVGAPHVQLAPPANDDFNQAVVITTTPYQATLNTTEATTAADDPALPCGSGSTPQQSNSVWYRFVAPHNGRLYISTYGSDYDTVMAVWTGNRGALVNQGCNDDAYTDFTSYLALNVTQNITYHLEILDYGAPGGGNLQLYVEFRSLGGSIAWPLRADLPNDRDRLAVASDGTYVYAIGGEEYYADDYQPSRANQRYDPLTNSWSNLALLPEGYSNIDAAYLNGRIYIPAGYNGTSFAGTHYVYNISTNSWTTALAAPWAATTITPVLFYAVAANPEQNVYYVTGGYNGTAVTNELLRYNAASNTWTTLAPMPTARYGHEAVWLGGKLYVAGGGDSSFSPLSSAAVYNPATNSWSSIANMNVERLYAANGTGIVGVGTLCRRGVLLVDDDWDMTDSRGGGRPFYTSALEALKIPHSVWDVASYGSPSPALMASFDAVIWFTGYAWKENVFTRTDELSVTTYLNGGGSFLLSSEDYLYESGITSFAQTYLGVQGMVNDVKRTDVVGVAGHPVGHGLGPYTLQAPAFWPEPSIYSDDIIPTTSATTPFKWQGTGNGNATAKRTTTYRTLFLAWPLEGVVALESRVNILRAALGWLCKGDNLWYITGGGYSSYGDVLNMTEVYNPATNSWTLLDQNLYNLHESRRHLNGAVTEAGLFYVVGGDTNTVGADGDVLSAVHERLSQVRSLYLPSTLRNFCPNADPYEPNDGFGVAYPINSGVTYQGNFACGGDQNDMFRFQLAAAHTIEIWLTHIPAGSNFSLALYNAAKQRVTYSTQPGNADEHILTGTMQPGTYYIQVYNQGGTYGPQVTYQLRSLFQ